MRRFAASANHSSEKERTFPPRAADTRSDKMLAGDHMLEVVAIRLIDGYVEDQSTGATTVTA